AKPSAMVTISFIRLHIPDQAQKQLLLDGKDERWRDRGLVQTFAASDFAPARIVMIRSASLLVVPFGTQTLRPFVLSVPGTREPFVPLPDSRLRAYCSDRCDTIQSKEEKVSMRN